MRNPTTDDRKRRGRWIARHGGFTLVEMLVVITIILLISAVTLPVVIPALNNRQVGESARILQAAISGARDAAIRANAPRGIRLLPDTSPGFNIPPQFDNNGNLTQPGVLTYSRMIPIEPGPEYSQGRAQIVSDALRIGDTSNTTFNYYDAPYPYPSGSNTGFPNGLYNNGTTLVPVKGKVLRLEEDAFTGAVPNNPTSWWWNIRVGDKLRIDDSGQYYTVVGPITIHPKTSGGQNPELFVNDGPPGDVRANGNLKQNYGNGLVGIEFLYLVNGQDDDNDGYIDDGWDGIDNNLLNGIDDIVPDALNNYGEWENEAWLGSLDSQNKVGAAPKFNIRYTITRRPVPSPSAREIALPGATVIDATTWNSTSERSRLPIDPVTGTVDILLNQSGEVVSTFPYSTPASFNITGSFYHFWIADRTDVVDPGVFPPPAPFPSFPTLPMVEGSPYYSDSFPASTGLYLKKDRVLLTLFTKSGLLVTNSIESFDAHDVDLPYRGAQLGTREVK